MTVSPLATGIPGTDPLNRADTPEEAAEQFEALLVRQFVDAMTKDLFKSTLVGGGIPEAQADAQREAMVNALTEELVESGAMLFRDLLLRQWQQEPPPDDLYGLLDEAAAW